jgi:hypothetical protein
VIQVLTPLALTPEAFGDIIESRDVDVFGIGGQELDSNDAPGRSIFGPSNETNRAIPDAATKYVMMLACRYHLARNRFA